MLANLLVIFFFTNILKQSIDDKFKRIRFKYNDGVVSMNELMFSFVTSILMIFGYVLSLLSRGPEFLFGMFGFNIAVLLIKLNQYKRDLGTRALYVLYTAQLLMVIQLIPQYMTDPAITYTVYGALILLIPEPLRNLRILLSSLDENNNSSLWLFIRDAVVGLDTVVTVLFKSIISPIFCLIYVRAVPNVYSAIIAFVVNSIDGVMRLIHRLSKYRDVRGSFAKYIPNY
ncbi:hypothetical protein YASMINEVIRUS_1335 [Yasminevirus sp. GU-2018]|uniref:Uncharacterized protein n=1 Tax=Yasminevirus sp. GU-2018 TaxID=2420051 RepID=A0A5K0UB70_9VIRU|nr:hypothetical protein YASMINEVIRUS_1335 [Yasminevirus sp. GU-2018]